MFSFASSVLKKVLRISYEFQLQLSFGFLNCPCMLRLCVCIPLGQSILTFTSALLFSVCLSSVQEFRDRLWWPSVMPALLSACQKGLFFYFEKAVFEDKAALLCPFGRPEQSIVRSCRDDPWINQNMLY